MEVDISGGSLRAFYRSVAFLARVGPEILMDARADGPSSSSSLSLKSVNAARSAFARVRIARDAFDAFDVRAVGGRAQTCVLAKHALASLRSHARSDGCALSLDEATSCVRNENCSDMELSRSPTNGLSNRSWALPVDAVPPMTCCTRSKPIIPEAASL